MTETYSGTVRKVWFCNRTTPAMAGTLLLDDDSAKRARVSELRFSGKVAADPGDKLEITGDWMQHPKFGRQFEAKTGLVKMDESPDALVHLLATDDRFKGLGPVLAKRVVDAALALSEDGEMASALATYTEEIAARAKVPLEVVRNASIVWNERRTYFDALALLCEQGWSNAQAQSIVAKFGENAPSMVKGEPYMLIGQIKRFGFRTVDAVARKMGVRSTDPFRLAAGIAYCLDQMGSEGNTWAKREGLIAEARQELRPDTLDAEDAIRDALDRLISLGSVYSTLAPNGQEIVADTRLAAAEFEVFEWLLEAMDEPNDDLETGRLSFDGPRAQAILPTLNRGQAAAVYGIWSRYAMVITGGAGVGKTYTMRSICEIAEENKLTVALCAPTGKAAKKLAHATGRDAMTIHRLLEPTFDEENGGFKFRRHKKNWLDADLVVVDEVSMVDVRLMRSLLHAMPDHARLLLVGDHHQIPSVSPGAILRDLLVGSTRTRSVHKLTEIVRQAGELARNTTAILDGIVAPGTSPAWGTVRAGKEAREELAEFIVKTVENVITAGEPLQPFGRMLDPDWDVQVLAPMKKGPLGTYALNARLQVLRQQLLGNPAPPAVEPDERPKPLTGDRVLWTKNDYHLGLFNGTQGIVKKLDKSTGMMFLVLDDGREVEIPGDKRIHVELSYAMTIHKSQGSEWPYVILVASSAHWNMHDRNLLYTGASRAAESLTIVGDQQGIAHFAREQKSATRQTFGEFMVQGWRPSTPATLTLVEGDPQAIADDIE